MKKLFKFVIVGAFSSLVSIYGLSAYAAKGGVGNPGKGHGHGYSNAPGYSKSHNMSKGYGVQKNATHRAQPKRWFTPQDQDVIAKYNAAHPFVGPELPPGIAMNLARGKPLPPGIEKRYLPDDLTKLLPSYPGYEYLSAGKNVLLVNKASNIVVEILSGKF